ncbi:hypothetical protein QOT17_018496 [Balamuthia mandrillaris]
MKASVVILAVLFAFVASTLACQDYYRAHLSAGFLADAPENCIQGFASGLKNLCRTCLNAHASNFPDYDSASEACAARGW